jgi:N-acetylglutamate synthase-like GNAT family acetyltransferase
MDTREQFMKRTRNAYLEEALWVNERYKEAGFLQSDIAHELVAIAEHEGLRAGLGRLVPVKPDCAELGGIYVLPQFRHLGIATEIVSYLLRQGGTYQRIFCLPFEHLEHFYSRFGFRPCTEAEAEDVPREVQDKHRWCNSHYEHRTLLLVRTGPRCQPAAL